MNDEDILEEIKKLYAQPLTEKNYQDVQYALTGLYGQLSYSRPYEPRELFPNLDETFKLTPEIEAAAQKIEDIANSPWKVDASGEGNDYFSCMEELEKITGQTFLRDYVYPNNLTAKEFQKSFNPTRMNRDISTAYHLMASYGLMNNTIGACSQMLFVEKNKATSEEWLNKSYEDFWQANKGIDGFDYLKNINGFSKKREFLMGVASEIPLADVEAYLKDAFDNIHLSELDTNAKKFDDIFHCAIPFTMTDATWGRFVEPVVREKENGKESRLPEGFDPVTMKFTNVEAEKPSVSAGDLKDKAEKEKAALSAYSLNPETGEFEKAAGTEETVQETSKEPGKKFNFETGKFEYADSMLQKIAELRRRLKAENTDPLAAKQSELIIGLEDIGLSKEDLGKTGDSRTGEVSDKHRKVAESQAEDAKELMILARNSRSGETR